MKITALKPQTKNENRVNVSVDGKYSFSLTLNQILETKIKPGLDIDESDLRKFQDLSKTGLLIQRCINYCFIRPRFVSEVRTYLYKKGCSKDEIESVLSEIISRGILDEEKSARFWIENRMLKKGISSRRLRYELGTKGVDKNLIERLMAESSRDESSEISKVLIKKYHRYEKTKLLQHLTQKGFLYDDAVRAIEEYEASQGSV